MNKKFLSSILALIVGLVVSFGCTAEKKSGQSAELLASAPVLQILIDNSGSSPAHDQQLMERAWPLLQKQLLDLSMGSVVYVNTVGSAEILPQSFRIRVQNRRSAEGAPINEVLQKVKSIVLGFPGRIKDGKVTAHGSSHLIGGLFDASKAINHKSEKNVIVYITDLIEFSQLANCYKSSPCKLPAPSFELPNTQVVVMGAGVGMPSDRAIGLVKSWEDFFKKMNLSKPVQILTKSLTV